MCIRDSVSAAAAVVLGFVLWGAVSTFGLPDVSALTAQQPTAPHERFGTKFSTAVNGFYKSLDDTFKNFTLTAESGLEQMRDVYKRQDRRTGQPDQPRRDEPLSRTA